MIPQKSAHSKRMKLAVLVEEDVCRLRNQSRVLEWEVSRNCMEEFARKLKRSGYAATVRHQVVETALRRWRRMSREEDEGVRPVGRSGGGRRGGCQSTQRGLPGTREPA